MVSKETIARGLIGFYLTARYIKEMEKNYRKGDWLEAAKDTGWFAIAITPVVAPRFFFGTIAYPVTVGVGTGLVATALIVELTGVGDWEDVVEMALDPPSPKEWYKVVAPEVKRATTEAVESTLGVGAFVYRLALSETNRRLTQIEEGAADLYGWVEDLPGAWQNPTWGLPYV
jgi:hypothetical protein